MARTYNTADTYDIGTMYDYTPGTNTPSTDPTSNAATITPTTSTTATMTPGG